MEVPTCCAKPIPNFAGREDPYTVQGTDVFAQIDSEVLQNIKINHVINRQESLISGGLLQCGESGAWGEKV